MKIKVFLSLFLLLLLCSAVYAEQKQFGISKTEIADMIKQGVSPSELIKAIQKGNDKLAYDIIERKSVDFREQDEYGYTALMWAILLDKTDIAMSIRNNSPADSLNILNNKGFSALFLAVMHNNIEVVKDLVGDGWVAETNNSYDENGDNCLMFAIKNDYTEIAKTLIAVNGKFRVLLNRQNKAGKTALILAIEKEDVEIVDLLVNAKYPNEGGYRSNVNLVDNSDKTAYDYAIETGNEEIIAIVPKSR